MHTQTQNTVGNIEHLVKCVTTAEVKAATAQTKVKAEEAASTISKMIAFENK
jgi:hypothetical protein